MRYPRAKTAERGYGSKWRTYRAGYLKSHPLCTYCDRQGKTVAANVVDHIKPHKGDQTLFWDPTNHQALCKHCHDAHKQSEEDRGYSGQVGADGWPVDPRHPANGGKGGS